jgi:hypothetical protein
MPKNLEGSLERVTQRTRLVTGMDFLGEGQLLFCPFQKAFWAEALSWLRGLTIDNSHGDDRIRMHIQSKIDTLDLGGCGGSDVTVLKGFCFFHKGSQDNASGYRDHPMSTLGCGTVWPVEKDGSVETFRNLKDCGYKFGWINAATAVL